ncbi:hypothetical protein [Virgibacillus pantothenticus]|uniref:hypothetical protein n=1 Tax=Virgibacillus pantothenticus TaxID=1473 RepID=UPI001BAFB951|nr:hypothetical protein [Virgibacillus pantothenticus]
MFRYIYKAKNQTVDSIKDSELNGCSVERTIRFKHYMNDRPLVNFKSYPPGSTVEHQMKH